jgi:putative ABC transport system permease protein
MQTTFSGMLADARYGWRVLKHEPGFAGITILTVALGIGLTTTLFSVANGVLLKPLPWSGAERLVRLTETREGRPARIRGTITNGTFLAWHRDSQLLDGLGGYATSSVTALPAQGDPMRLQTTRVTPSVFEILNAHPLRGRLFEAADAPMGSTGLIEPTRTAILSYGVWQQWFGGRDDAVGRTVLFNGRPVTVIGIMPRDFAFPDNETRVWMPLSVGSVLGDKGAQRISIFSALGRMKAGVTPQQVAAEGTARARSAPDPGLAATGMFGSSGAPEIAAVPMLDAMTAEVKPAIVMLLAAVVLLLATATANAASLQLARLTAKRRDMALRAAIGATSARLTRQLVMENVLLGIAGGLAGLGLTAALHRALPWLLPADFPRIIDISIDGRVLVFTLLAALATSIACGFLAALKLRRFELVEALADGGAGATAGVWHTRVGRTRTAIMAVQVAVACVLLVGASLLVRSFAALLHADRGYEPANVLTARIDLPASYLADGRVAFGDRLMERLRAVAGITHVAIGNALPFVSGGGSFAFEMPSPRDPAIKQRVQTFTRVVSPDYFQVLRLRVVQGRPLTEADTQSSRPVIVVNRTFARQYLADTPLGARVPLPFGQGKPDCDVVGVVDDMRQADVTEPPTPEVFVSYRQMPARLVNAPLIIVVRTAADPVAMIPMLQVAVREQDRTLALDSIMTLDMRVMNSLSRARTYAAVLGGFALCALVIAGVGLFGLLSYSIAQRSREIGLRTALGAEQRQIIQLVLRQGLVTAAVGIVGGLTVALASAKALSPFLFGIATHDVLSFAVVAAAVTVVTMVASVIPARRAARLDPLVALRGE